MSWTVQVRKEDREETGHGRERHEHIVTVRARKRKL